MKKIAYNFSIGMYLLYGVAMNILFVMALEPVIWEKEPWWILFLYIVLGFLGVIMLYKEKWGTVFVGYNFICLPSGAVLAILLKDVEGVNIVNALFATGILVVVMMTISMIFPKVFEGMGSGLLVGLIIGVIISLFISATWLDWIFIIFFGLYVGYDWVSSQQVEKTQLNAIRSAADLYLDIINIFVRILDISERNKE
jgi:FtsH-binding integral membrane protein